MGGVMVSGLTFKPRSGQTKNYKIGIGCFSTKHAALRRKNKDCLAQNYHNVFEWGEMSLHRPLFECVSTIKNPTKCVTVGLV